MDPGRLAQSASTWAYAYLHRSPAGRVQLENVCVSCVASTGQQDERRPQTSGSVRLDPRLIRDVRRCVSLEVRLSVRCLRSPFSVLYVYSRRVGRRGNVDRIVSRASASFVSTRSFTIQRDLVRPLCVQT